MTITLTTTAEAAVYARRELKAAFPNTKFSVRQGQGSMRGKIRVYWKDGPAVNDVRAALPAVPHIALSCDRFSLFN